MPVSPTPRQLPLADVLVLAAREFVAREDGRAMLDQDVQESRARFARNGLHLTGEEINAWLDKIKNGKYEPPPPCHI